MWAELSSFEFYIGLRCLGSSLDLGLSCIGLCFMWAELAELAWTELVLGRVVLHPAQVDKTNRPKFIIQLDSNIYFISNMLQRDYLCMCDSISLFSFTLYINIHVLPICTC